jgi:hypothetical protein
MQYGEARNLSAMYVTGLPDHNCLVGFLVWVCTYSLLEFAVKYEEFAAKNHKQFYTSPTTNTKGGE